MPLAAVLVCDARVAARGDAEIRDWCGATRGDGDFLGAVVCVAEETHGREVTREIRVPLWAASDCSGARTQA